jgi:hypothetical protein
MADAPHLVALLEQREVPERGRRPRRADHQLLHAVGVRAHLLDARLRAPQPRAGDELERLRDLARVADGGDPPPEVLQRRHLGEDASSCDVEDVLELPDLAGELSASSSGRSPDSRIVL